MTPNSSELAQNLYITLIRQSYHSIEVFGRNIRGFVG